MTYLDKLQWAFMMTMELWIFLGLLMAALAVESVVKRYDHN